MFIITTTGAGLCVSFHMIKMGYFVCEIELLLYVWWNKNDLYMDLQFTFSLPAVLAQEFSAEDLAIIKETVIRVDTDSVTKLIYACLLAMYNQELRDDILKDSL